MTDQDDLFKAATLNARWTYAERAGSADLGYSLTDNPGNFIAHVKAASEKSLVSHITTLLQDTLHDEYAVEVGVTASGVAEVGQEAGILIVEDDSHFVFLAKSMQAGGSRLRAYAADGGAPALVQEVDFDDSNDLVLRIEKFDGVFSFLYRSGSAREFQTMTSTADASGYDHGPASGHYVGLGAVAGAAGANAFDFTVDRFYFRKMETYAAQADTSLSVTNIVATQGNMSLDCREFPPPLNFLARQHIDAPVVTLSWDLPVVVNPVLQSHSGELFMLSAEDGPVYGLTPVDSGTPVDLKVRDSEGKVYTIFPTDEGVLAYDPLADPPEDLYAQPILVTPTGAIYWLVMTTDGVFALAEATHTFRGVTLVRKEGAYPNGPTDGTVLLTDGFGEEFIDDTIPNPRARQFYAVFGRYDDKMTFGFTDATMPTFANLYVNAGKRFSKEFLSGPWSMLYAFARALTDISDTALPGSAAQFNAWTAFGEFLDLWGRLFGTPRYPTDTDASYAGRTVSRVLSARTTLPTIKAEVLKVPGVVSCDARESSLGSMFFGYSFIGYSGSGEIEADQDFISPPLTSKPFHFDLRLVIRQATNLGQIIDAVKNNKAAGTKFAVEIVQTVP